MVMEETLECPLACVYELPGEPAVVIDGVPDILVDNGDVNFVGSHAAKPTNKGFGQWLKGRQVHKLFGQNFYSGEVTGFDTETGWYRVVYEDGDFEDLEWEELQDVLLPLDITMPLKSLALKMLRKSHKTHSDVVAEANRTPPGATARGRGRGRGRGIRGRGGRSRGMSSKK